MFDRSKFDLCGECLVKCQYVDCSKEKAKEEIDKLIKGEPVTIIKECVTCFACNQYCEKGLTPSTLSIRGRKKPGSFWLAIEPLRCSRRLT